MYARLQTISPGRPLDPEGRERIGELAETISGHPGFAGLYLVGDPDTGGGALLTLWRSLEDARRAPERTAAQLGPRPVTLASDEVWQVTDRWEGPAAAEPATDAVFLHFDGPLSDERVAASAVANRDRVRPALTGLPGVVAGFALWQPHRRAETFVSLATSAEALRRIGETVLATELLPGEDPALLAGPDRILTHRVIVQATALAHR